MSSSSDKAPAPKTDFAAFVDNMSAALEASTSAASGFPDKSDLNFHRSLDRSFARGMDSTSARLLQLTDRLLDYAHEGQKAASQNADGSKKRVKPRRKLRDEDDVVDSFKATVVDTVDGLLEDADTQLDDLNGMKKKPAIQVKDAALDLKRPNPTKAMQKGAGLPKALRLDNEIAKPQYNFKDGVDNDPCKDWCPNLPHKHHAMVPMDFKMPGEPEHKCRHPYHYETQHIDYPTALFVQSEPQKPASFKDTPFTLVETPEQLEVLTEKLKQAKEIAVDLEHHSTRSYYGFTCLMQISTREEDFVVDTLALRQELRDHKLGGVFADPSIVKVFHGADSDMVWLQHDYDMYVVNLFDTFHACRVLDFPKASLASLLEAYCDFEPDKRFQMADWRIRPLPEAMLYYARSDTHFLLYIFDQLRNALIQRASRTPSPADGEDGASTPKPNPQEKMRDVLQRSAETALKMYSREPYDVETGAGSYGWCNLHKKIPVGKRSPQTTHVFRAIHAWRDNLARELDESPHFLMPHWLVIHLATAQPTTLKSLCTTTLVRATPLLTDPHYNSLLSVILQAQAEYAANPTPAPIIDRKARNGIVKPGSEAASRATSKSKSPQQPKRQPQSPQQSKKQPQTSRPPVAFASGPLDVWSALAPGPEPPTSRSALFGSTLPAKPAVATAQTKSSLFGNAVPVPRLGAANGVDFAAIQSSVFSELGLDRKPAANPVEPSSANWSAAPAPETVPFVPAAKRNNQVSDTSTSTSKAVAASVAETPNVVKETESKEALVDEHGVVAVKKRRPRKRKHERVAVSDNTADKAQSASTQPAPKPKKDKIKPTEIPVHDYSQEASLLDRPAKPKGDGKGKGKKKSGAGKKRNAGEATSAFRPPPSNPSEPKAGNKSATF